MNLQAMFRSKLALAVLAMACGLAAVPASAEIYRYTDAKGRLHFSDRPPPIRAGSDTRALTQQTLSSERFSPSVKIYKFVDARGVVHLTDNPPNAQYKLVYSGYLTGGVTELDRGRAEAYADLIQEVADRTNLEAALLHAVIRTESAYNPKAISPKGAVGLMQLMPGTAERYGVSDRTDPRENLHGGAQYLSYLLQLFDNDLKLALAGYNAGENAVIRYGKSIPPYRETQAYVDRVLSFYQAYIAN